MSKIKVDEIVEKFNDVCLTCLPLDGLQKTLEANNMIGVIFMSGINGIIMVVGGFSLMAAILWSVARFAVRTGIGDVKEANKLLFTMSSISLKVFLFSSIFSIIAALGIEFVPIFLSGIGNMAAALTDTMAGMYYSGLDPSIRLSPINHGQYDTYCNASNGSIACVGLVFEKSVTWAIANSAAMLEDFKLELSGKNLSAILLLIITIMGLLGMAAAAFDIVYKALRVYFQLTLVPFMFALGSVKSSLYSAGESLLSFLVHSLFLIISANLIIIAASYVATPDLQETVLTIKDANFWIVLILIGSAQKIMQKSESEADKIVSSVMTAIRERTDNL